MKKKVLTLIAKINTVVAIISLLVLFPGSLILANLFNDNTFHIIIYTSMGLAAVNGLSIIVLTSFFGVTLQERSEPETIPFTLSDVNAFYEHIKTSAEKNDCTEYLLLETFDEYSVGMFIGLKKQNGMRGCISVLIKKQIDSIKDLSRADDIINKTLSDYFNGKDIPSGIKMTTVICVDSVTPAFKEYITRGIERGFGNMWIPIGVVMSENKIYLPNLKSKNGKNKYNQMAEDALKIILN